MNSRKSKHSVLYVENFGPIQKAEIEVGDITVFVGPQSSGKSVAALLLAYFLDRIAMEKEMSRFGFWTTSSADLMDVLFFPGARRVYYNKNTQILFNGEPLPLELKQARYIKEQKISHKVIYIPAQRSNLIFTGYPMALESLPPSLPFPARFFSSFLRQILSEIGRNSDETEIFPRDRKLRETLRSFLQKNIIMETSFVLERDELTRQMVIKVKVPTGTVHIASSASGLRESFPILMTVQYIMGKKQISKQGLHLIVEEPETNLHPDAIKALLSLLTYLVSRGLKVILTTHSPYVLELLHFFKVAGEKYRQSRRRVSLIVSDFLGLHNIRNISIKDFLLIGKSAKVYHFEKVYHFDRKETELTVVKDISDLASDTEWGGLASFTFELGDYYEKLMEIP